MPKKPPGLMILMGEMMKGKGKKKEEPEAVKAEDLLEAIKEDDGKKLMELLIKLIKEHS